MKIRLPHTLTYWGSPASNGRGGYTYATPTTIKGRWEEKQELFVNSMAQEVRSTVVAFVASDVVIDGYLALGTYTDTDPTDVSGAQKVQGFEKIPDIKASGYFTRKAYM